MVTKNQPVITQVEYGLLRAVLPTEIEDYDESKEMLVKENSHIRLRHLVDAMPGRGKRWIGDEIINEYLAFLAKESQTILPIHTRHAEPIANGEEIKATFDQVMHSELVTKDRRAL